MEKFNNIKDYTFSELYHEWLNEFAHINNMAEYFNVSPQYMEWAIKQGKDAHDSYARELKCSQLSDYLD